MSMAGTPAAARLCLGAAELGHCSIKAAHHTIGYCLLASGICKVEPLEQFGDNHTGATKRQLVEVGDKAQVLLAREQLTWPYPLQQC